MDTIEGGPVRQPSQDSPIGGGGGWDGADPRVKYRKVDLSNSIAARRQVLMFLRFEQIIF
jgi:hypothetical protein